MGLIEFSENSKTTSQFRLGQAGHQYAWQVKNAISRVNYDRGKNGKTHVQTCNNYTMGCPPVRGDNPRALASGLSRTGGQKWYNYFIPPTSV